MATKDRCSYGMNEGGRTLGSCRRLFCQRACFLLAYIGRNSRLVTIDNKLS